MLKGKSTLKDEKENHKAQAFLPTFRQALLRASHYGFPKLFTSTADIKTHEVLTQKEQ